MRAGAPDHAGRPPLIGGDCEVCVSRQPPVAWPTSPADTDRRSQAGREVQGQALHQTLDSEFGLSAGHSKTKVHWSPDGGSSLGKRGMAVARAAG
jgi:hypothetical protein